MVETPKCQKQKLEEPDPSYFENRYLHTNVHNNITYSSHTVETIQMRMDG